MKIDVLTLFPEMFSGVLGASMLGRAQERGILEFGLHNIREYSQSKHKNTDDYPFGGGAGMVMMPQPIFSCLDTVDRDHTALRIVLTPRRMRRLLRLWRVTLHGRSICFCSAGIMRH